MPKKLSTNPKAEAARERKESKKKEERDRVEKEKEDALWRDDHKQTAKKQQRKEDKDQKRLLELQRKKELKALLEKEDASLGGKSKSAAPVAKVTRAQIEAQKQKELQLRQSEEATKKKEEEAMNDFAGENPNRSMAEHLEKEGVTEARNIEDAIAVLKVKEDEASPVDKHPEKRMKAAYAAFEEVNLPRLKEENPNLRMSQLKQLLRKEWMKSSSNPMNQALSR